MAADPSASPTPEPTVGSPLDERPWWRPAIGLAWAWVAVVHGVLWWLDGHPSRRVLWGDETGYVASAGKLLAGDPGWWPEPLWPPFYPQFLAGVGWFLGPSTAAVAVVQTLLLAAAAVLLGDLTRRLTGSRAAGVAAAALTLGYPPLAAFSHYLWPEVLHLFLFAALLWLLVARWRSPGWCAVAGVVLGLALLSKSLLLPFVPVLLVAAAWRSRAVEALPRFALVLVLAGATVAPTLLANQRRIGSATLGSSAAFNLWVGLNDVGRESFRHDVVWPEYQQWQASAETYGGRERVLRTKIRALVRDRGVIPTLEGQLAKQYFRLFDAGCYLIDQLPGGAAQRQSNAGYLGLGPGSTRLVSAVTRVTILGLLVAVPLGLVIGGCTRNRWVRVLVLFLLYNLLLFLGLHVKTRYRIQMLPAAFVAVGCLVAWFEAGMRPRPSVARLAGAGAVAAVLLWFALA